EVFVQISAGRISIRTVDRREPPPRERSGRVRAARYWHLRGQSLLRYFFGICQGRRRRHASQTDSRESRPRACSIATIANHLVPEHLVLGRRSSPLARFAAGVWGHRTGPSRARQALALL